MPSSAPSILPSCVQTTLKAAFSVEGISLHSGKECRIDLKPGKEDAGIRFFNADFPQAGFFKLNSACLQEGMLATIIAPENYPEAKISTTEHFLAALSAFEIDNLDIEVHGGEIPIADGCAQYFSECLEKAGKRLQTKKRKWIEILKEITVSRGDASASLLPSAYPEFQIEIDFPVPAIGHQKIACFPTTAFFKKEIAPARTFVSADQLEQLREKGLIKGGSLNNALVADGDKILNPEGVRYENEFVRHKLLDAIGDLYCAGHPILGIFKGIKSGHNLNRLLLQALFADPSAYRLIENPNFSFPSRP